jgi:hypothetical protein
VGITAGVHLDALTPLCQTSQAGLSSPQSNVPALRRFSLLRRKQLQGAHLSGHPATGKAADSPLAPLPPPPKWTKSFTPVKRRNRTSAYVSRVRNAQIPGSDMPRPQASYRRTPSAHNQTTNARDGLSRVHRTLDLGLVGCDRVSKRRIPGLNSR